MSNNNLINKKYNDVLNEIDDNLKNTHEYIGLLRLKAEVFEKQGRAKEAYEILKKGITYFYATEDDKKAMLSFASLCKRLNKELYGSAQEYYYNLLTMNEDEWKKYLLEIKEKVNENIKNENMEKLAQIAAMQWNMPELCVYIIYLEANGFKCEEEKEVLFDLLNGKLLYTSMKNHTHSHILVCTKNEDVLLYENLAFCLQSISEEVVVIMPPMECDVEEDTYDTNALNQVTIENEQKCGNVTTLFPLKLIYNDKEIVDTTQSLLIYLNDAYIKEDAWLVYGNLDYMKDAYINNIPLRKNLQIFNRVTNEYDTLLRAPLIATFFMGSFMGRAEKIYFQKFDTPVEKRPAISVIIPTRGGIETLEKTLKTCIEQDGFDDYEIVVSDNSDMGDTRTYELIQKINNVKIKYYKTPYVLPLNKSFEFAYLNAKGDFLMTLGSDDALLSYSLKIINEVLEEIPHINILSWKRLLYMWPTFNLSGEADKFLFPNINKKVNISVSKKNSEEFLNELIDEPGEVYYLPLCYINSGMKRNNINEFVKYTGKFMDGLSQDIYTGVLNCFIYEEFYTVEMPLSIAGMSNESIGANSLSLALDNVSVRNAFILHNFESKEEVCFVYTKDIFHLDRMISRVKDYNIRNIKINDLDYQRVFAEAIHTFNTNTKSSNTFAYIMENAVKETLPQYYESFCSIMEEKMNANCIDTLITEKDYYTGIVEKQWLVIDSSKFDIENVYDAMKFFVKLYDLYF